jgi:hypothetical protein
VLDGSANGSKVVEPHFVRLDAEGMAVRSEDKEAMNVTGARSA